MIKDQLIRSILNQRLHYLSCQETYATDIIPKALNTYTDICKSYAALMQRHEKVAKVKCCFHGMVS